jgi:hypothetical protein
MGQMSDYKEFSRKELYDLVWSTPMTKLAKKFGFSDVGLRKICIKHDIPTPPLGYWAKLQFGKHAKQTPFPPTVSSGDDRVYIFVSPVREMPDQVIVAEAKARQSLDVRIVVPNNLPKTLHRVAVSTKRSLRAATPNSEGFVSTAGTAGTISVLLSKPSIMRATAIIDTIVKTLENRGQQIIDTDNGVDLVVDGELLKLSLNETKKQEAHQPTQAELRAKAKREQDSLRWPSIYSTNRMHWRKWDHLPSGRLCVVLENPAASYWKPEHLLGRWYDRTTKRVEDYLNEIVVTMHSGAALVQQIRLAAEEEERRRQEAADRLRRMQERKQRIAKREAFIEEKAIVYAQLTRLRAFGEYLSGQSQDPNAGAVATIERVAQEMIQRLTNALSVSELNQEIGRLGLYAEDDQ